MLEGNGFLSKGKVIGGFFDGGFGRVVDFKLLLEI